MNFPKEKIVDFAECNEMFPSPLIEKVSQLLITSVGFFDKILFSKVYTASITTVQFLLPLVMVSI